MGCLAGAGRRWEADGELNAVVKGLIYLSGSLRAPQTRRPIGGDANRGIQDYDAPLQMATMATDPQAVSEEGGFAMAYDRSPGQDPIVRS